MQEGSQDKQIYAWNIGIPYEILVAELLNRIKFTVTWVNALIRICIL